MSLRLVVGWAFPCVVASLLLVVLRFLLCVPLPPAAAETPALALSPVGVWVPIRLWGSSPPAAGVFSKFKRSIVVIGVPRARRVASLALRPRKEWPM